MRFIVVALTTCLAFLTPAVAQNVSSARTGDRVLVTNEDSNTIVVIDPVVNRVVGTINLTSFDEDPRPPFQFASGGVIPTHAAMILKPLYHGAISLHGAAPSPNGTLVAATGRGSSNVYLIDIASMAVIGNRQNPRASTKTTPTLLTSGVMVGREPHEPTFSPNGKELWVAIRGEDRIAILDVETVRAVSTGGAVADSFRNSVPTVEGPAQVWFSKDGGLAFVISQKVSRIDVFDTAIDESGYSRPKRLRTLDISEQDPFGFTPFQKLSPDGKEMWFSHKLADAVSSRSIEGDQALIDLVPLGRGARPNHIEFVQNNNGNVIYVTQARVDDDGPDKIASSRIAIIDRSVKPSERKVLGTFFSHGRDSHGIWANPANDRIYVSHEQDELPGTPNAGQGVVSVFDVSDPLKPRFVTQIPIGHLELPSGKLRNKKSINLVYISQEANR